MRILLLLSVVTWQTMAWQQSPPWRQSQTWQDLQQSQPWDESWPTQESQQWQESQQSPPWRQSQQSPPWRNLQPQQPWQSRQAFEALEAVSGSVNTFASNFVKAVAEDVAGNFICSPISVSMVLSMAAFGARGETERKLRTALALPGDDTVTKTGFQSLIDSFQNYKQVELGLANKIFLANSFEPKAEFNEVTGKFFRSEAQSLNFQKGIEASKTINDWCEEQTNYRIKDLIKPDDLNADTTMVLVNAVYFKGTWAKKFRAGLTRTRPFHIDATTVKNVPTMYRSGSYRYGELPEVNAKFVELPYKSDNGNDAISMFIILPDEITGLAKVEKNLDKITIDQLLRGITNEVEVYLPKFKIESEIQLREPFSKLGLGDMFTDKANFAGIVDSPPLQVGQVIQKAFIEVNEEGSEAAAATGIEFFPLSLIIGGVVFNVNRPSHFIIMTRKPHGHSILFSGSLHEPVIA